MEDFQLERAAVLRQVVESFGMKRSERSELAWGRTRDYIQGSLRHAGGIALDCRMSNTRTARWPEGFHANGKDLLYALPGRYGHACPDAVEIMMNSRGQVVTVRVSIFDTPYGLSEDFEVKDRFIIDPTYSRQSEVRLAFF